jgi:hypothetical protein
MIEAAYCAQIYTHTNTHTQTQTQTQKRGSKADGKRAKGNGELNAIREQHVL